MRGSKEGGSREDELNQGEVTFAKVITETSVFVASKNNSKN